MGVAYNGGSLAVVVRGFSARPVGRVCLVVGPDRGLGLFHALAHREVEETGIANGLPVRPLIEVLHNLVHTRRLVPVLAATASLVPGDGTGHNVFKRDAAPVLGERGVVPTGERRKVDPAVHLPLVGVHQESPVASPAHTCLG